MDRERIRQMTLEAARIVAQEREWHPVADAAARNDRTIEVFAQLVPASAPGSSKPRTSTRRSKAGCPGRSATGSAPQA